MKIIKDNINNPNNYKIGQVLTDALGSISFKSRITVADVTTM